MIQYTPIFRLFSSVGGGPLARLGRSLDEKGFKNKLVQMFSPEQWRSLFGHGKSGRLTARALSFGIYPIQALAEAIKTSFWDVSGKPLCKPVLIAATNPFFLPHFLVLTKPLHRCSVIALLYDMYPDALEAAGINKPWLSKLMTLSNKWMIAHADAVVHLGDIIRSSAEKRYGTNPNTFVIPTGASMDEFDRSNAELPEAAADFEDRIIFSYVGNMGLMHDAETLERSIPQFLNSLDEEERSRVGFIFAATGPGEARLRKSLGNLHKNVRFVGPLPDVPWANLLKRTDAALATLSVNANATSVPSKMYSAIAADCIPIAVAPQNSDIAKLILNSIDSAPDDAKQPCGFVVPPGDADGLCAAFRMLMDSQTRESMRIAVKRTGESCDVRNLADIWLKCAQNCLRSADAPWASCLYHLCKRTLDICTSSAGLLCLSPILAATALAVRINLGTPVCFVQERPGLDGKPFNLIKFRSMQNAPLTADASKDAERLTPFGRKIRALSIDELPTLLNVLKGDMSLVGPRPLLMRYIERYDAHQIRRQWAKPGITGWAQVHGRNALAWEDKFDLDVWYAEHASLWLDLQILVKTVSTVLKKTGISHENSATMPEFMGNSK